jgi:hypothetical protein
VNIEDLLISSSTARKRYSAAQIMSVLDGAGGGGTARTEMTATYTTSSIDPTVYYTSLLPDGSLLVARTTSGVTFAVGFYRYIQNTTGITDFIAVWDEGDANDFASEWITVDT